MLALGVMVHIRLGAEFRGTEGAGVQLDARVRGKVLLPQKNSLSLVVSMQLRITETMQGSASTHLQISLHLEAFAAHIACVLGLAQAAMILARKLTAIGTNDRNGCRMDDSL